MIIKHAITFMNVVISRVGFVWLEESVDAAISFVSLSREDRVVRVEFDFETEH